MPQICERNWSNLADGTLIINYFLTVIQINISSSSSFRHFICSGKTQAYRGTVNVKQLEPDSKEYSLTASLFWWLCDRVPDLQSGGCGFESRPGLLRTKVYSAFHPSGVGKWVPATAGKAKAGLAHAECGWTLWVLCRCEIFRQHVSYLSAPAVAIHYIRTGTNQVYAPLFLPLPLPPMKTPGYALEQEPPMSLPCIKPTTTLL